MKMLSFALVGDIGATNARFALVEPDGTIKHTQIYSVDEYRSLEAAIDAYMAERLCARLTQAVLAVASPVSGDQVTMTNHPWSFSIEALRQRLKLERLRVINDFVANALAIPYLGEGDRKPIGSGCPEAGSPIGVIGPGSGLGVGGLIPTASEMTPIASEGGHVTMAAANEKESAVLSLLRKRYDHVSAERVLSGPGLVNLYEALRQLSGAPAMVMSAEQITNPNSWDEDPFARESTAMFCAMLGSVAGNLALTLGAGGGIYIAGGIVPKLGLFFERSDFRRGFEAKGRFRSYLVKIPTYVITHPAPALLGAAALLK
jgi:glucokinase